MSKQKSPFAPPTPFNKAKRDKMQTGMQNSDQVDANTSAGIKNMRSKLTPRGQKGQPDGDNTKQLLKDMENKYDNKLANLSKAYDNSAKYMGNQIQNLNEVANGLHNGNQQLGRAMQSMDKRYGKAMGNLAKAMQSRGGRTGGGPGRPAGTTTGGTGGTGGAEWNTGWDLNEAVNIPKNPAGILIPKEYGGEEVDESTVAKRDESTVVKRDDAAATDSAKFDSILPIIRKLEGGYQNHKSDKDGNTNSRGEYVGTNWGISAKTYEDHIGHPPSEQEMRGMKREEADLIFKTTYWEKPKFGRINDMQVATLVFDHGINSHPRYASKLVYRTLNDMGYNIKEKSTLSDEAIVAVNKVDQKKFFDIYKIKRHDYYDSLTNEASKDPMWIKNWSNRVEGFNYK